MLKVGLTGGIGSGKSTAAGIFSLLGVHVYHADSSVHALMAQDQSVQEQILVLLGNQSYDAFGKPDRKYIASRVFSDTDLLERLNAIVHPAVRADFERWCQAHRHQPYVIQEAAVLFESRGNSLMDEMILVWAPENLRIERVIQRDQVSPQEVRARMLHQWDDLQKTSKSQFILINDEDHSLIRQVVDIHRILLHLSGANAQQV